MGQALSQREKLNRWIKWHREEILANPDHLSQRAGLTTLDTIIFGSIGDNEWSEQDHEVHIYISLKKSLWAQILRREKSLNFLYDTLWRMNAKYSSIGNLSFLDTEWEKKGFSLEKLKETILLHTRVLNDLYKSLHDLVSNFTELYHS